MLVVRQVVGNINSDATLAAAYTTVAAAGSLETVHLSQHDAQRRRLRVTTDGGTEVGIDISGGPLREGDVLFLSPDGRRMIVVRVEPAEALRIRLGPGVSGEALFELGVRLGHVLGNQHWPVRVEGRQVLVPVTVDRRVMEKVLQTYGVEKVTYDFVPVQPGQLPYAMPPVEHYHGG